MKNIRSLCASWRRPLVFGLALGVMAWRGGSAAQAQGQNFEQIGGYAQQGASCVRVALQGNILWTLFNNFGGGQLMLNGLDVSNPATPQLIGSTVFSFQQVDDNVDLAVQGNYVYVAIPKYGVMVIDVTNPASPAPLDGYPLPSAELSRASVLDGKLYAGSMQKLFIFDIGVPSTPSLLGSVASTGLDKVFGAKGSMVFSANQDSALRIYDMGNPAAVTLLGLTHCGPTLGGSLAGVLDGSRVYLAQSGRGVDHGVEVYDVTRPSLPRYLGGLYIPASGDNSPYDIKLSGREVLSAMGLLGVRAFNVSRPARITQTGFFDTPGKAVSLAVDGSTVYVGDASGGMIVLRRSASQPLQPGNAAQITPGNAPAPALAGRGDRNFTITMRNMGTTTWTSEQGYSLAIRSDDCALFGDLQYPRLFLQPGQAVLPYQTATFYGELRNPPNAAPGPCAVQFQMVQEFVEFFGPTVDESFTTAP